MRRFTEASSIRSLLERYKTSLRAPQGVVIKAVAEAYNQCGVVCTPKDFRYSVSTKTISIQVTGPQKMEMLLRKDAVMAALRTTLSSKDIPTTII